MSEVQFTPPKVSKRKAADASQRRVPRRLDPNAEPVKDERFAWWPKDAEGNFIRPGDGMAHSKEEMEAAISAEAEAEAEAQAEVMEVESNADDENKNEAETEAEVDPVDEEAADEEEEETDDEEEVEVEEVGPISE
jgi:hypothetical protein